MCPYVCICTYIYIYVFGLSPCLSEFWHDFTHMTHGSLSFKKNISLWISQHRFSLYTMRVSQKAILKQTLSEAALCRPESCCLKDAVFLDQNSSYDTNMSTTHCQSLFVGPSCDQTREVVNIKTSCNKYATFSGCEKNPLLSCWLCRCERLGD